MKQLFVVLTMCVGAVVTGGCASSGSDQSPIPRIEHDEKVYNTGSRIGRPERGYETPAASAKPDAPKPAPAAPTAPAPAK